MVNKHVIQGALGGTLALAVNLACGASPSSTPAASGMLPSVTTAAATQESVPGSTSPTVTDAQIPTSTGNPAQPAGAFSVAVIVDLNSEPVSREQAQAVVSEASSRLHPLTSISMLMSDFVEDADGGSTQDMASRFVNSHRGAEPNGLVVFSAGDGGQARLHGGYGYAMAGLEGFRNSFVSPVTGSGQIYLAVVYFSSRYAECGYDGSETVKGGTSLGSECRNQPGTACAQHNGYSICSDALSHLYASTPTYYVSSTIVHELLHLFSPGGDQDHYDTPECRARMGYPEQFHDLQEAQYHNLLCPYVYEAFAKSYQP